LTGYYKKPAEAGKLYPCKKCNKTPTVGQDRYYEQIDGPDGTKVWVGCVDFECFKAQGGSAEAAQQKKFTPTKFPIADAPKMMELTESLLKSFMKTRSVLPLQEQAIFIESIFRTLSSNYKP